MVNKNYAKGRAKEERIAKRARDSGCIAIRSAQSRSPVDVVIIDPIERRIRLVQSKAYNIGKSEWDRMMEEMKGVDGTYEVKFEIQ